MKEKLLNLIMVYGGKIFHSEVFQSIFALWIITIGILVVWLFIELVAGLFPTPNKQEPVAVQSAPIVAPQTTKPLKVKKASPKKKLAKKAKKRTK